MDAVNGHILIIDDDGYDASHLRDMLHQYNFNVTVLSSLREALDFLNDHIQDIDFVLVAVEVEEIPGFEFIDMAIEMFENIEVISPRANTHVEQSNATNSSTDEEYNIYEVQSSTGSNSVDMGLVDYPDSEDGETVEQGPKRDQDSEVVTSPKEDQDSKVVTSPKGNQDCEVGTSLGN